MISLGPLGVLGLEMQMHAEWLMLWVFIHGIGVMTKLKCVMKLPQQEWLFRITLMAR